MVPWTSDSLESPPLLSELVAFPYDESQLDTFRVVLDIGKLLCLHICIRGSQSKFTQVLPQIRWQRKCRDRNMPFHYQIPMCPIGAGHSLGVNTLGICTDQDLHLCAI
jgi:hypothetical protein